MVNEVRTLLLNRAVSGNGPDFPGEQYIPPDFRRRAETSVTRKIRQIIFGGDPDQHMLNYRGHQLMQVLHSTELDQDVRDRDQRITYLPLTDTGFYQSAFTHTITPVGTFIGELFVVGTPIARTAIGKLRYWWQIDITSSVTATVKQLLPPFASETVGYSLTDSLSSLMPLQGAGLQFRFRGPVGAKWLLETVARPTVDLATLVATLRLGLTEPDENALFGVTPSGVNATYRSLWHNHSSLAYQLGGLLLALADQTKQQVPL